jgi:hypothetical protein
MRCNVKGGVYVILSASLLRFFFFWYLFPLFNLKKRHTRRIMAFTNITLPFASTPICAVHAPTVHAHVQASVDKIHDVAPYILPSLTSFISSNWAWHWTYLVYAFLAWQILYALHLFWWKAPVCFPFPFPPHVSNPTKSLEYT